MKYSKDKKVAFNQESHSYFLGEKRLTSVTTLISKFKNDFDSDFHSKRIAEKRGVTQDEVLLEWSEKAKRSCDIGTAIHKIFEDYCEGKYSLTNGELSFEYMPLPAEYFLEFDQKRKVSLQFITDFFISGRLNPVYTEHIVYNNILAGQIDMVCVCPKGNYYIIDFKTNSTIDTYSYGKQMKGIMKNYPDANFYHYSLQLSVYKQMIKENIKHMYLIHIMPDKYKLIDCVDIFQEINFNEFLQS